ncbi:MULTISPECIES: molybdate ABC transporter permease subunit [Sellimonas]|uniref:Molybdenum transport system permease n=1 Tax=Sellimonas caecigallum TaxID=2592333 RepID=A0ABS7LA28_9FIRM|nr:molybdate ABC transporter permease subunit [Sellimonas caecigallum]MBY0759904.1 molybdate ABC transporter permease subunit [Sellimonas caecigallum]OUP00084.1 molybdenum ABC transporter permease subunit [Drancourtella sp. An210]OUP63061.1 molybdenum ABC transporter permease subunit [Drancourtella sp. An177]
MDFSPVWISLKTTACASAVTFVLGILAAWAVMFIKGRRLKAVVDGILTIPLVLPPTVAGFFLLYLFGARRPIGSFVEDVFGFRIAFSWFATVLAAVIVSFPLMYRSAKAGFEQIDQNMIEEAKMMGLGKWGILWKILFPCTFPSILSGMILSTTRGLGEYGATAMLAGNIPGKTRTLPLAVYSEVAAGNMDRAWIYVAVILGVAFIAVWIMNMTAKADREIKM